MDLSCRSCQVCLASNVLLKHAKSLKPIPSCSFGLHSSSHLTQCNFRLSPRCPQKNLRMRASMSWQRVTGSLKHEIVYVGSAWATALIKISLPAYDRSLPSHPWSFFHTLCLILSKLSFFFRPMKLGNPKYFSYCLTTGTPGPLKLKLAFVGKWTY